MLISPEDLMIKNNRCPHCGANMKMYWHTLTPSLVKTLIKIYIKISNKGVNQVHPHDEMDLTTSEHMNMTKLRFHGMIAKCRDDAGIRRGYWLITKRGARFLRGEIAVPKKVQTFRNRVVGHSENLVDLVDVLGSEPFIEKEFDFDIFSA